jgi:TPR repeat protein
MLRRRACLAWMYHDGQGVPQDYAEAMKWVRKAADQGDDGAQTTLGYMYSFGQGMPQDYAEAAKLYRKAADQGNTQAQGFLGGAYFAGLGVPQDYVLAHMWLNLAVAKGDEDSFKSGLLKFRNLVARRMTPIEIAEAQRLAREWKPKQ